MTRSTVRSLSGPSQMLWPGWAAATVIAAAAGLAVGWAMPRGPVTTAQALTAIVRGRRRRRRAAGGALRRRDVGSARHGEVLSGAGAHRAAHRRPHRRRHARGHRLPPDEVRQGADLPHGQLVGHHPRGPGRPGAPRRLRRVPRDRPDGRPLRDRPAHVRGEPRPGASQRRHGTSGAAARHGTAAVRRCPGLPQGTGRQSGVDELPSRGRLRPRLGVSVRLLRRRVQPSRTAPGDGRARRDLRRAVPAARPGRPTPRRG